MILKYLYPIIVFVIFTINTSAQAVGSASEEAYANRHLLDSSVQISGIIRSVLNPKIFNDTISSRLFLIKPANTILLFQYNSFFPYNWNDGALLPVSGNQQMLSAGAEGKFKNFEFRISPEFVFAQNLPYDGFPLDHYSEIWRDYYRFYNFIETPERFGIFPIRKVYGGQSFLRYNFKKLTIEASTANKWWGPGQRNALLLSNTAPGIPHLALKTNKPIQTKLGDFEFEVLYGLNFNSAYPPADSTKVYRSYRLYIPKEDILRVTKGFILSWQPRWVKGLYLGIEQMDMSYLYETKNFSDWIPFQPPFKKNNKVFDDRSLLLSALFLKYQVPNYQMEIYGEFGWNKNDRNFREFIINPDRSLASILGFKKLFPFRKNQYWELKAELTNLQLQSVEDIFVNSEPRSWYLHPHIRQGHTHAGQFIGSGTGPGGNSQFIEFNWRENHKRLGISLERKANNNDFYTYTFTNSYDFRRFWIDFSATAKIDWQLKNFLIGSRFSINHSNNYQWWLYAPGSIYFVKGRDVNYWSGQFFMSYLFEK